MLIDSNILIEVGRKQRCKKECRDLIDAISQEIITEEVYITRFALSAFQAIATDADPKFVREILLLIHQDKIKILNQEIGDDIMTLSVLENLHLDFDDATQFVAANKLMTYLVTYDKDFKKTGLQTKTPKEILKKILA
jgi:predicted nucleic acid-binding protein